MPISQERLKELFDYDPETGVLTWLKDNYSNKVTGLRAGSVSRTPHRTWRQVGIDGGDYKTYQVIWCWMTGEWPEDEIDHRNLDSLDDSWNNLRLVTRSQNCTNRRGWSSAKLKGVSKDGVGSWRARITKDGETRSLGSFDCPAAASFAYQIAADELHGEFARW